MTANGSVAVGGEEGRGKWVVETPEAAPRTLFQELTARTTGTVALSDFLRVHGVPLNTRCGGRGLCESCTVELVSGTVKHASGELITAGEKPVAIKACEISIPDAHARIGEGEPHIRVPARSYLRYTPQIVTEYRVNIPCGHDPLYALSPEEKAILQGRDPLGAAIDVGTTTVAVLLVNLVTGKVLAQAAMFNQQMNLGDDVVTRITLCANDKPMIRKLQTALMEETIRALVKSALVHARMNEEQVRCFSIAGNTTMLHLAAGVDPTPLGTAPFTPVFLAHRMLPGNEVFSGAGIGGDAGVAVHLLPSAAAYIGADLTAGVVASGMLYDEGPCLLVDVGTNGEIILKHNGKFLGCATAAGPAFEGAGLSCGMRAGDNVIAYVTMSGTGEKFHVETETIGHEGEAHKQRMVGMCGSAYIDFLAEGRKVGLLGETGRFDSEFDSRGRIIPWDTGHDRAFRLGFAPGKQPIGVSERDIASLLQAKAATAAGVLTLLSRAGLEAKDVKRVYLAGGFGTKMRVQNAIACGLLPGFDAAQIQAVGNTSLAGAYVAMLDRSLLGEMARVGATMEVVELNLDPGFEERYIEQLMLP